MKPNVNAIFKLDVLQALICSMYINLYLKIQSQKLFFEHVNENLSISFNCGKRSEILNERKQFWKDITCHVL